MRIPIVTRNDEKALELLDKAKASGFPLLLQPAPTQEYPNAVKCFHAELGHLGFVGEKNGKVFPAPGAEYLYAEDVSKILDGKAALVGIRDMHVEASGYRWLEVEWEGTEDKEEAMSDEKTPKQEFLEASQELGKSLITLGKLTLGLGIGLAKKGKAGAIRAKKPVGGFLRRLGEHLEK